MGLPACERVAAPGVSQLSLVAVALLVLSASACGDDDPLAARLQARAAHEVTVESFQSRDDDTILVELAVRSPIGPLLDVLTVTIRQHDAEQEVMHVERVPLDLSAMDATGVLRLFTRVTSAAAGVEALSAIVEPRPPEADYPDFPEIQEVLP